MLLLQAEASEEQTRDVRAQLVETRSRADDLDKDLSDAKDRVTGLEEQLSESQRVRMPGVVGVTLKPN